MGNVEKNCNWHFAEQLGGREDGPNDPMQENFKKTPYSSLIRESIQNSLDVVLDKNKNTLGNLINHTPFFIWSSDIEPQNINKVTMQMNILPTVLNLFGVDYNSNYYLGTNALADDYKGIAFFSDYSWYDGNVYVSDNEILNDGTISKKKMKFTSEMVNNIIRKNDLTLKYDYFKSLNKK